MEPIREQEHVLRALVRRARGTAWGRASDLAGLDGVRDVVPAFQARVPLQRYETLQPFIERMRAGEADVLWPGVTRRYAISSGTASAGKLLPAGDALLRTMARCSLRMGLAYLARRGRYDLLRGKLLTLPGRVERDPAFPRNQVGEMSGLVSSRSPVLVRRFLQAVPNEVLLSADWTEKLAAVVERTASMDVRALAAVPTWAPMLFEQLVEAARRQGKPARSVGDVWPNLRVFFSGGVALDSYRAYLEQQLPGVDLVEAYSASEGFFGYQTHPEQRDMRLHLGSGVFYEFVRMEDLHRPDARRHTVADVETGVRYALFVTTCGGLWAYGVRDVLRFTSTAPLRIVVAGRTTEMLDTFGEAVFADEVSAAVAHACGLLHAQTREYHVAPRLMEGGCPPRHQWFVEFSRSPTDTGTFARLLDTYLCEANRHYQIRRAGGALGAPELVILPAGSFYRWIAATRSVVGAQTKVPRVREDRAIADALIRLPGDGSGASARAP